jgi:hypothetical protein
VRFDATVDRGEKLVNLTHPKTPHPYHRRCPASEGTSSCPAPDPATGMLSAV